MTTAAQGVQKALARAGNGVVAVAEMPASDLLAAMSDEQKAALAAELAPSLAAAMMPEKKKKKMEGEAEDDGDEDDAEMPKKKKDGMDANASAFAQVHARFQTVMASDHYAGNEALAQQLLGNEKLSAAEITAALATVKKPDQAAANAAAEEAGRAEMRAALTAATGNSDIAASGGGTSTKDTKAEADAVWDRARATIEQRKGA